MWNYIWPVLLILGSNIAYNLMTKSTPAQVNPFASLTVTYLVAAVFSFILLLFSSTGHPLADFREVNWTGIVLGMAIVGLELGYICLYRAGWNISVGSLVANVLLAACLLAIGLVVFKEAVGVKQVLGIAVCLCGLVLINMK
ncbi:MAG: EamA family transporter [Clostridia bacterium]